MSARQEAANAAGGPAQTGPRMPPNLALGIAGFCTSISWQAVVPVLPLYLAQLGYSTAAIGVVAGLFSVTMAVTELQAGRLAAAFGRRRVLLNGYVANAICLSLVAAAHGRAFVAGSLSAAGAARGIVVPPLHATVAHSAAASARGRAFGLFWLWTSFAALSGPAMGGFLAARYGYRAAFVLAALFSLVALVLVGIFTRPSPDPRTGEAAGAREREGPGRATGGLSALLSDPGMAGLGISTLLCYSLSGIWATFLPLYAAHRGVPVQTIGLIFAAQGGAYALMQLPTGRLIRPERGRWMVAAGVGGVAAVELGIPFAHAAPALIAAGALFGVAIGLLPVTLATLVTWRVPPDRYTGALAVYNAAIDFGLFFGPLLGAAVARFDVAAPFALALPLGLVAVVLSLRTDHGRAAAPGGVTSADVVPGSH